MDKETALKEALKNAPIAEIKDDGWGSRKFISLVGSAYSVMVFCCVAMAFKWIEEPTFIFMECSGLIAIFAYGGINLTEKLGGFANVLGNFKSLIPSFAKKEPVKK